MKRIGYIDGRRLFLADGQAISFGTDKDIAVSFNASLDALEFAGHIYLPTDKKQLFRNADAFIHSQAVGHMAIQAITRVTLTALQIYAVGVLTATDIEIPAAGDIGMGTGKIKFQGDYYWPTHYIWSQAVGHIEIAVPTRITLTAGQIYAVGVLTPTSIEIPSTGRMNFRDLDHYIHSQASGHVEIVVPTRITLTAGQINLSGYLKLHVVAGPDPAEIQGQLWFDSGDNKLHFWDGTADRTVTS